jgi:hypothetical protein
MLPYLKTTLVIMLFPAVALCQVLTDRQTIVDDLNRGNAKASEFHFAAEGPAKTMLLIVVIKSITPEECKRRYGSEFEPNPRFEEIKTIGFTNYGVKCTTADGKSYIYSVDLTAPGQTPHFTPEPPPDVSPRTEMNSSTQTSRRRLLESQEQARGQDRAPNAETLSGPEPSLDFFDATDSLLRIPIKPFVFTRDEIPFAFDPRPEMFDPVKAGQEADAIDLGLRNMVRNRASDAELRSAVDKLVRWSKKMERLRSQYYAGGLAALDTLAERNLRDSKVLARCATRWVDAVEVERMEVLATVKPVWRGESNNMADVRVDPQTYLWRYPKATPNETNGQVRSAAFPRAQRAIQRALSVDPISPEALFASARLLHRQYGAEDDLMLTQVRRAAQSTGPYSAAARLYVLEVDTGASQIEARALWLRNVQRAPTTFGVGEHEVGSYSAGDDVPSGQTARGGKLYAPNVTFIEGPIIHTPTAQDVAEADALDAQAKRIRAGTRIAEDSLVKQNPTNEEMFVVLATYYGGALTREHILRYALFLDPGDYRLYWLRDTALAKGGNWMGGKEDFGPHNIGEASDFAQWAFRRGQVNDEDHCVSMTSQIAEKYKDPFTYYAVALHCMHLEPDRPAARRDLVASFMGMSIANFLGSQLPDSFEQGQLESEVMYQIAARLLEHKEEWRLGNTQQLFVKWMALAKFMRGEYMRRLHRDQEARLYYLQSIKLDPTATPAQKELNQMSKQ